MDRQPNLIESELQSMRMTPHAVRWLSSAGMIAGTLIGSVTTGCTDSDTATTPSRLLSAHVQSLVDSVNKHPGTVPLDLLKGELGEPQEKIPGDKGEPPKFWVYDDVATKETRNTILFIAPIHTKDQTHARLVAQIAPNQTVGWIWSGDSTGGGFPATPK
jgi:hypothetical protein